MIYRWWSAPHQNLRKGSRFPTLKRPCLRDRGAGNDWPTSLILPSFWPKGNLLVFNVFVALFGFCISIGQFSFHLMSLLDREAEKHQWSMCRNHRFEVAFVEASIAWYRGEPLMSEDWVATFELSERCCLKFDVVYRVYNGASPSISVQESFFSNYATTSPPQRNFTRKSFKTWK